MVELVEVEDESFETKQAGPLDNEDDYYTDTESEISSDEDENFTDEESFGDRIYALRDIISPATRAFISNKLDATTNWVKSGLIFSGKSMWILSTSVLLIGVPWALAFAEEQQVLEMEKEMKMREMGNELLSTGSTIDSVNSQLGGQTAKPPL